MKWNYEIWTAMTKTASHRRRVVLYMKINKIIIANKWIQWRFILRFTQYNLTDKNWQFEVPCMMAEKGNTW